MTILNENLTEERWFKLSFFEQMANLGSEVIRAIKWKEKDHGRSVSALESALELLDLTINDKKNKTKPKLTDATIQDKKNNKSKLVELCRLREVLADYFCFDNIYGSSDQNLNSYFYGFNYAASLK